MFQERRATFLVELLFCRYVREILKLEIDQIDQNIIQFCPTTY